MGIPCEQRGAISDETLRIVRKLWTEETVTHHGTRWNFDDVKVSPKPLQKPHVPILVGGESKAAQVRAGKLGDGWHPTGVTPEEFPAGCAFVRTVATKEGRDPSLPPRCLRVNTPVNRHNLHTK